jgi:isopenicillin N synthase-like dioxygenase
MGDSFPPFFKSIMKIPVIDLKDLNAHEKLDDAFKTIGFAYFKTDIDIFDIMNHAKDFFALPLEEKNKLAYKSTESNSGYQGMIESLTPGTPVDLKEAFNWCEHREDNQWYNEEQKTICKNWNDELYLITNCILSMIEIVLDLRPMYLIDKHMYSKSTTTRMLHYPPWNGEIQENQMRGGEHTDYGTITILFTDKNPGLQIKPRGKEEWIDAPYIPNTCIINVGDLLQRWTNDIYVSTPHRVVNEHLNKSRYSFPHFVHPRDDVIVGSLVGEQKYDEIGAKDYLVWRLNQSY